MGNDANAIADFGAPEPQARDRSVLLAVAGTVEILIGGLCAAMAVLSWLALRLSAPLTEGAPSLRTTLPVMILYGILALAFVVLGIGSLRARRWACALMQAVSRIWLLSGLCTVLVGLLVLPALVRETSAGMGAPPGFAVAATLVALAGLAITQVAVPAALWLVHRSPEVAATCRARNPRPSLLDDCPQPLLSLAVLCALAGLSVVVVPAYNFVFPFFGRLLVGRAGVLPWLAVAVACLALAWGSCRRRPWAWWGAVAATLTAAFATLLTALAVDLSGLVEALALPPAQARAWAQLPAPGAVLAVLLWLAVWGSLLLWLASLRRHFGAQGAERG
jgi:hypothetical protein